MLYLGSHAVLRTFLAPIRSALEESSNPSAAKVRFFLRFAKIENEFDKATC